MPFFSLFTKRERCREHIAGSIACITAKNTTLFLLLQNIIVSLSRNNSINNNTYNMTKIYTTVLLLAMMLQTANAQLIINEVMQSNIDCIMDDLNEFPDSWVELYNSGDQAVNLQDYKLGLKDDAGSAFQLPSQTVAAHGYVVIFCDKSDEPTGLHTDFRLDSGKGNVYLFHEDEVDTVALKKMPAPNIAYGRVTDGADAWGYQQTPTPGAANCGSICTTLLGEPVFSEKGRVLTSSGSISLSLSLPEGSPEGTEIRYTTDGTEPTQSSNLYQSPFTINSNRVIRAKLFCDGYLSPISTAQSYIFLGRDMKMSVISIVTDDRYLNASDIGIIKNNPDKNNKHDWRRPINIEMFDEAGAGSFINQLCETRVGGGQSRQWDLKTLIIYANKRFGVKRFSYEFFPDQKPGLTEFKSLMLRNAGNDFDKLYMRDPIIQRVMGQNTDIDWQAWKPAIVYINGTYKGMLNIRERSNDDNVYTNYDELEDIDMIEVSQENSQMVEELKTGTWDRYNAFKAFYHESGHTMAEYNQIMDCQEYINIMAMNLYYGNLDFPGNNLVVWVPTADGGRWRWIAKDTDFGLGLYNNVNHNTIKWIYNNNYDSSNWANTAEATQLFRSLMDDTDFNREFIDHCAIYMGDFLNARGTHEIWDPMENLVKSELIEHRKLYQKSSGWWGSSPDYEGTINNEINKVNNWLSQRTDYFYKYLADYYGLGTPTPLVINRDVTEPVTTIVNGIEIKHSDFDGKFFANRQLTVKGKAGEGRKVIGWKIDKTNSNNSTSSTTVYEPIYTFDMPSCKSLVLTALFADFLLGDVNRDGSVNIADVTAMVNIINNMEGAPLDQYDSSAADMNDDGTIDQKDVTELLNTIMEK